MSDDHKSIRESGKLKLGQKGNKKISSEKCNKSFFLRSDEKIGFFFSIKIKLNRFHNELYFVFI